jgi:hypothetical protein
MNSGEPYALVSPGQNRAAAKSKRRGSARALPPRPAQARAATRSRPVPKPSYGTSSTHLTTLTTPCFHNFANLASARAVAPRAAPSKARTAGVIGPVGRREQGARDGAQSRPDTYASADVSGP